MEPHGPRCLALISQRMDGPWTNYSRAAIVRKYWKVVSPENVDPQDFRLNTFRDASGTVTTNKGRKMLNFAGVHYIPGALKRRKNVFSVIRSFDVCRPDKRWSHLP
jgi:hypothetical protein